MATTSITIPDPQIDRVAESFGWPGAAMSGEAKGAFIRRSISTMLKAHVRDYEARQASAAFVPPALDVS